MLPLSSWQCWQTNCTFPYFTDHEIETKTDHEAVTLMLTLAIYFPSCSVNTELSFFQSELSYLHTTAQLPTVTTLPQARIPQCQKAHERDPGRPWEFQKQILSRPSYQDSCSGANETLSFEPGLWVALSPSPLGQHPLHTVGHNGIRLAGYFSPAPTWTSSSHRKWGQWHLRKGNKSSGFWVCVGMGREQSTAGNSCTAHCLPWLKAKQLLNLSTSLSPCCSNLLHRENPLSFHLWLHGMRYQEGNEEEYILVRAITGWPPPTLRVCPPLSLKSFLHEQSIQIQFETLNRTATQNQWTGRLVSKCMDQLLSTTLLFHS